MSLMGLLANSHRLQSQGAALPRRAWICPRHYVKTENLDERQRITALLEVLEIDAFVSDGSTMGATTPRN